MYTYFSLCCYYNLYWFNYIKMLIYFQFASDELCGAISPTPVSRVRHKSIQSDNEVVKLKVKYKHLLRK